MALAPSKAPTCFVSLLPCCTVIFTSEHKSPRGGRSKPRFRSRENAVPDPESPNSLLTELCEYQCQVLAHTDYRQMNQTQSGRRESSASGRTQTCRDCRRLALQSPVFSSSTSRQKAAGQSPKWEGKRTQCHLQKHSRVPVSSPLCHQNLLP